MGATLKGEANTSASGMITDVSAGTPAGTSAGTAPSVSTSAPVEASNEPSVPVDAIIDGESLVPTAWPTDAAGAVGNVNTTGGISIGRALDTTIAVMDTSDDTTVAPSHGRASNALFVAVKLVVNIPSGILSAANIGVQTSKNIRAPVSVNPRTSTNEGTASAISGAAPSQSFVAPTSVPNVNEWGRHGFIVAEIYKILAMMEPPWGSLCVFEAASRRFPEVDPTALQMTFLAVLMTQRQCVRELNLAGARRGPRRDENGEVFIELDLVYANRYSNSY